MSIPPPPLWPDPINTYALPSERRGVYLPPEKVRSDLLVLLSLVLADERLSTLYTSDHLPSDPIDWLRAHSEPLVRHLLLSSAIALRVHDDDVARAREYICGALWEVGCAAPVDLTLREACNKIVHATAWRFDYVEAADPETSFIRPIVFVGGKFRSVEWRATVDLVAFARWGSLLVAR